MNSHVNDPQLERLVQRCIDGEMTEAEQQRFLLSLEQSPAGWRHLALAFVEHQLWSQAGRAWMDEPEPLAADVHDPMPTPARNSWLRSTAMLASCLLAVGLGYLGGTYWKPGSPGAPSIAGQTNPPFDPGRTQASVASQAQRVPVGAVELRAGPGESVTLPLIDTSQLPRNWWVDQEVPAEVLPAGDRVDDRPRYYTFPYDQHRNVVVPLQNQKAQLRVQ